MWFWEVGRFCSSSRQEAFVVFGVPDRPETLRTHTEPKLGRCCVFRAAGADGGRQLLLHDNLNHDTK